jgi:peptide/nickel transport system substrate-binding protein
MPIRLGLVLTMVFLAACAPAAPASPTSAPAPKPTAGTAPAAALTRPAAQPAAVAKPAASVPTGTVTMIQGTEITRLDGSMETGPGAKIPASQIFDALTWRDESGNVQPHLATSWSYPNDRTIRLKIRKGVKFHNGELMTPDDVVFTYLRVMDPANKSGHLFYVRSIRDVRQVDDETVDFAMETPDPTLLGRFSLIPILPRKVVEALGPEGFDQGPVGSGPWKLQEWVKGQRVVLEANPDYWRGPPKIKTLVFRGVSEDTTRVTELLTGRADIVTNVTPELAARVTAEPKTVVQQIPSLRNVYVLINTKRAPFDDVRVRQALNHAVDVKQLVASVLGGGGVPTPGGVMGPGVFGHNPSWDKGYDYDPARAKQLLAAAGVQPGFKTTLLSAQGRLQGDREVSQAIAGMLRQVGIDAEVQFMDKDFISNQFIRKYNEAMSLLLESGGNDTADADRAYSEKYLSANRAFYWSSPEVEPLITSARATLVPELRLKLYHEIGARIAEAAPVIFLYDQVDSYGVSKRLQGFRPRRDELIYLYEASVAD